MGCFYSPANFDMNFRLFIVIIIIIIIIIMMSLFYENNIFSNTNLTYGPLFDTKNNIEYVQKQMYNLICLLKCLGNHVHETKIICLSWLNS